MANSLDDLNKHLFEQLDRLSDKHLSAEQIQTEIGRTDSITNVSKSLISSATLQLAATKLIADHKGLRSDGVPAILIGLKK